MMTHRLHPAFSSMLMFVCAALFTGLPLQAQTVDAADDAVVEITATDYAFRAPDAIPSGWTTIRFVNDGEEPHFILLSRLPEGKTIDDYEMDVTQAFSSGWEALKAGEVDPPGAVEMIVQGMPEWSSGLQFAGGPGFTSPGRTSETVFYFEPGNYVLECYAKTEDGNVHMMEGMLRPLTVTEENVGGSPPEADIQLTLSNAGMAVDGDLTPGAHTISVHVKENPEQGFGHNAQLARLDGEISVDDVVGWLNWFSLEGVRTPAPVEFLGGVHLMPVGNTGYFTAELEPGRYAFISEYTGHQGVLHEFTVAP